MGRLVVPPVLAVRIVPFVPSASGGILKSGTKSAASMHGDTPPAIVAIDGALLRQPTLGAKLAAFLRDRPAWFVADDPETLLAALQSQGIHVSLEDAESNISTPERPVAVVRGGLREAVAAAHHRNNKEVRVWLGEVAGEDDMDMAVRIAAHDAGIRLRIEAPLAGAA